MLKLIKELLEQLLAKKDKEPKDFMVEVAKGNVPGHRIVHKYGTGKASTTPRTVTQAGAYQTPTAAVSLDFVSGSPGDTFGGPGANEITVIGLDASWNEVTQVVQTNGETPVTIPIPLTRMYRWYVSKSGIYASADARQSHIGILTIMESGYGTIWDTIPNTPIPYGRSVIGAYTVPKGSKAYLLSKVVFVDTSTKADVYFFKRDNADSVTAPYAGVMIMLEREIGLKGGFTIDPNCPKSGFVGPCDVGFISKIDSGSAVISVEFEFLEVEEGY